MPNVLIAITSIERKPMIRHGLRPDSYGVFVIKGSLVDGYGFILDALNLPDESGSYEGHPRLSLDNIES
jgi:hypothetical protein